MLHLIQTFLAADTRISKVAFRTAKDEDGNIIDNTAVLDGLSSDYDVVPSIRAAWRIKYSH